MGNVDMPFDRAIEKGYAFVLQELGFVHEQFPDGWFWHLKPDLESEEARIVSIALGFEGFNSEDVYDGFTIILQCNDTFEQWSYVWGADFDDVSAEEAESVLKKLWEQRKAQDV